ncbi:MAG: YozE family protein [Polyangiaceae bacterium]
MAAFTPFYDWLTKHKTQRTPVGEFAREVLKDEKLPREILTLETLLEYVKGSASSSAQLLSKARVTWKAFERGR